MKKKTALLSVVAFFALTQMVSAAGEKTHVNSVTAAEANSHLIASQKKQIEILNRVSQDPDFVVTDNDGNGNFAFVPSAKIRSDEDKQRVELKINEIKAQGTKHAGAAGSTYNDILVGALQTAFGEDITDTDPWFEDEQLTVASGSGLTQWYITRSPYNWEDLHDIKDRIDIGYTAVSNAQVEVLAEGGWNVLWQKSASTATQEYSWTHVPNNYQHNRYYSGHKVKTNNIKSYSHSFTAIADFSGASNGVAVTAVAYESID
ncbi:hypothetical protein [Cohnella sp. GbtcB17]|uniref:hypothetical protein n=1 Tax=Cohnella sp. GbtcB17 TaxID=2824762 RepID=UPI001C2F7F39|nr:hypothetical protein [Cohnella sp. GbtcB17]